MAERLRMREVAHVGARFRHHGTGAAIMAVQSHRADRMIEATDLLSAIYLPAPPRWPVSFEALRTEYDLLVGLERARL